MAIQFIIDSASDVLPSEAAELGVIHLPQRGLCGHCLHIPPGICCIHAQCRLLQLRI